MKTQARVVIIGGGALGVGLLYHLSKEGWSDVVLVEKGELTSGSTWHAAGLIPHFIGDLNMAKVHYYGSQLYQQLEAETGQATGWHGCGAIRLALSQDEVDWFHYVQRILHQVGAECHLIGPDEIRQHFPLMDTKGVLLGAYTPGDGHTDPASSTNAMAAGARMRGAEIYRRNRVLGIQQRTNGEWEIITEQGSIVCEHVVNAAGSFAPQVGAKAGLKLPIVNMVHQYLVTENIAEVAALERELPVVRDPYASCYYRQEQRGLIIGPYETSGSEAWGLEGIDWSFDMELLPPDIDRLMPWLERVMERIPVFAQAGIKRVVNGPITHTPDGNFLMGPAPGLRNHWLCCGASIGITQGPGVGKYLAQWMVHGQTEINVRSMDPRRFGAWAGGDYAVAKALDEYEHMYAVHYPGEYRDVARPVTSTAIYPQLKQQGAVFAEVFGWERAKWFDVNAEGENYSFRRNNTFAAVAAECQAVRERVGVMDFSSFAKFEVTGKDAETFLNRLCANNMPRRDGGIVLAHMLTDAGGIECEVTVTRLTAEHFYLLSAIIAQLHDRDWMIQHIKPGEDVMVTDVTDNTGMLLLTGPKSRQVLAKLTETDLNNQSFPWLRAQQITVAGVSCRALRVSYVGELGWELHHPIAQIQTLYQAIMATGAEFGIANFGAYAVNSLRLEKAYKGWGAELTTEITPIEARLERFVRLDLERNFIGRDAVMQRRDEDLALEIVYLQVAADDADVLGNEAIFAGDEIIGVATSGGYGHSVGKSLAFAYVKPPYANAGTELDIEILGKRCRAEVLSEAVYDPRNEKLRA